MVRGKKDRRENVKLRRVILYPLTIRIWHWLHALAVVLLVLTGLQLRFPDVITWVGTFQATVNLHNVFGFIVVWDYLLWFGYYLWKRELVAQYVPTPSDVTRGASRQAAYYLARIFFGDAPPFAPTPEAKFNALQKITYCGVMFLLIPLQIATGVLLWDVGPFHTAIAAFGGTRAIDALHIMIAYIITVFLIVHIYLATLGHTVFTHTKAMIVGYEEKEARHKKTSFKI
jgi:thiosulfate reductase cytochrome b subunit